MWKILGREPWPVTMERSGAAVEGKRNGGVEEEEEPAGRTGGERGGFPSTFLSAA